MLARIDSLIKRLQRDIDEKPTVDGIEQLRQLLQTRREIVPQQVLGRILVVALLTVGFLAIILLALLPISKTTVRIDVTASGVTFKLPDPKELVLSAQAVEQLVLNGLDSVYVGAATPDALVSSIQHGFAIGAAPDNARPPSTDGRSGIRIAAVTATGSDALVTFNVGDVPNEVDITVRGPVDDFTVTASGETHLEDSVQQYLEPTPFTCHPRRDQTRVTLRLPSAGGSLCLICEPVAVVEARPVTTVTRRVGASWVNDHFSSVLAGTIRFLDLPGRTRPLEIHDDLDLRGEAAILRSLSLKAESQLHFEIEEVVSSVVVNRTSQDGGSELMPSYLEWIVSRHTPALIASAVGYVGAVILGVARWFGIIRS